MNEKVGYTEFAPGEKSSQRLIYIVGMFWVMVSTTLIIIFKALGKLDITWGEISMYFSVISGVLSGTKLYQNYQEKTKTPKEVNGLLNNSNDPPDTPGGGIGGGQ